jgi:hypothetical protein
MTYAATWAAAPKNSQSASMFASAWPMLLAGALPGGED